MMTENNDELQFVESGLAGGGGVSTKVSSVDVERSGAAQTFHFTHFPGSDDSPGDGTSGSDRLLQGQASFWSFDYYQQLFDVNTNQVLIRTLNSFLPRMGSNFIDVQLKSSKPDLWGPVWICTTLVFAIAISGNTYHFLASGPAHEWVYDFKLVSASAAAIFTYAWLIPLLLWAFFYWRRSSAALYSCLELLCLYGYSLSVYIPASILASFPVETLQWIVIVIACLLSGAVIVLAVWPAVKDDSVTVMFSTIILVMFLHAALAIGFKMYFFHPPVSSFKEEITTTTQAATSVTASSPTASSVSNDTTSG